VDADEHGDQAQLDRWAIKVVLNRMDDNGTVLVDHEKQMQRGLTDADGGQSCKAYTTNQC